MSKNFSVVWITGASSGIGKAVTMEFASHNLTVAASSRNKDSLIKTKKEVENLKSPIDIYPLDVTKYSDVEAAINKITEENKISCLINNAGATSFKLAEENTIKEIREVLDTNLLGSINMIKAVLPKMIAQKDGTIINILSVAANTTLTKSSAYAASKAGLRAYAQVLREEVRQYNIRVINILPGATRTPIWPNEALEKYGERMMSPAELARLIYNIYSIKSNLVPEEIQIRPIKGDL